MVPKQWHDDALQQIEVLNREIAELRAKLGKMVERPVYDDLLLEYEKLKKLHSHLGDEKHK